MTAMMSLGDRKFLALLWSAPSCSCGWTTFVPMVHHWLNIIMPCMTVYRNITPTFFPSVQPKLFLLQFELYTLEFLTHKTL